MQRHVTLGMAIALIAISIAANLWMILGGMWPTVLFLFVGLLGVILLIFWILARIHAQTFFGRHVGVISVVVVLASLLTFALGIGSRHRETHMLDWSRDGATRVRLAFVDYPDFSVNVDSNQLAGCLQRQSRERLPGEFEITTDFGTLRSFNLLSVGQCSVPANAWSYAEQRNSGRTPW